MVFSLTTSAFAAETSQNEETLDKKNSYTHEISVTGGYIEELKSAEIISANVEWEAMNFTYAATQQGTWNPKTHAYDNVKETAAWVGKTTSDIKVTNHSNVDITASFSFTKNKATITGTFKNGESDTVAETKTVGLSAGVLNEYDKADNETVIFEIGGSYDGDYSTDITFGTITVSVDKKNISDTPEVVTYELSTQAESIFYWNMGGTQEKGDPDWSKVKFVVSGSDGNEKMLEYSEVTITKNFAGEMDLSMKPISEEVIEREYSFTATVSAEKAGTTAPLSCTFTVKVCNYNMILPPTGGILQIYL